MRTNKRSFLIPFQEDEKLSFYVSKALKIKHNISKRKIVIVAYTPLRVSQDRMPSIFFPFER